MSDVIVQQTVGRVTVNLGANGAISGASTLTTISRLTKVTATGTIGMTSIAEPAAGELTGVVSLQASGSAGLLLKNSSGSSVLLLGAGPSQGITAYGQINGTSVALSAGLTCTTLTASSLTSGRVPFASTGGLLSDSSSYAWDNASVASGTLNLGGAQLVPTENVRLSARAIDTALGTVAVRGIQSSMALLGTYAGTAIDAIAECRNTTTADHIVAVQTQANKTGSGTTNTITCVSAGGVVSAGTVTNAYGFYFGAWSGAGTITNKWAVYVSSATPSYFGGTVQVASNLTVTGSGNVAITGTGGFGVGRVPLYKFDIYGSSSGYISAFENTDATNGYGLYIRAGGSTAGRSALFIENAAGTDLLTLANDGTLTLHSNGVSTAGGVTSLSATAGIGYGTGAGGTVTQATSRTTGVTINKVSGAITLFSTAGSTTPQSFTVTNSAVAAADTIILAQKSGTDKYVLLVTAVAAGSFQVTAYTTGGTTSEAPVISFNVIKGVTA